MSPTGKTYILKRVENISKQINYLLRVLMSLQNSNDDDDDDDNDDENENDDNDDYDNEEDDDNDSNSNNNNNNNNKAIYENVLKTLYLSLS
jgi:hypothetical protein